MRCKGAVSIVNREELKPRAESGVGAQLGARALLLLTSELSHIIVSGSISHASAYVMYGLHE